jgi:hypothetical protein
MDDAVARGGGDAWGQKRARRIPTNATPTPRRLSAKPAIRGLRYAQGTSSPGPVLHFPSRP